MEQQREALLGQIWAAQDEAYDLMYEYDSLPHRYGAHILYQSEAHIIDLIGEHPEITVTELAAILKKTPSACSQSVRKLRAKGWVEHCSPISDTTIMASSGAQCYHLNHVATQLPYAVTVAVVAFVNYIITAFIQVPFICLPIAIVSMVLVMLVIGKVNHSMNAHSQRD